MAQHEAAHGEAVQRTDCDRDGEGDEQARDRRRDGERQGQRHTDHGGERAKRRELAEGQQDAAIEPVDQRIGAGEQRIDRRRGQGGEALLQAIGEAGRQNDQVGARRGPRIDRRFGLVFEIEAPQQQEARIGHRHAVGGKARQRAALQRGALAGEDAVDRAPARLRVRRLRPVGDAQDVGTRAGAGALDGDDGI
ncbi:hypothetical protein [Bosea vestrisii]|uniref:hypothetical protein n=1 Tax=Bosea vestrisii TaxID=151416 RepID=UPI003D7670C5